MCAGIGVPFWYASAKTFSSVHTDNGCSQCHCECVVHVVCLCLSVLEAPSVSLRHVRNAAGEVGDERKERGRKGQEDDIFQPRRLRGRMARVFGCVSVHYLLTILTKKVTSWFALVWRNSMFSLSLALSLSPPQAVGCDIIDLGEGKSLEREPVSPHEAAIVCTQCTHSHMCSPPYINS